MKSSIEKTKKNYYIPLDKLTSEVVLKWYEQTKVKHQGSGWVFPGRKPDSHLTSVYKSWNNLLKRAKIKDFVWHDQRHDFASQLAMSGTDLYTIQKLLGHSSSQMTQRYAHLNMEHKMKATQKLSERRTAFLEQE